ncbi:hypothetical protein [Auraticoccus monumenti]|uniref:Uncharacterized protein n=1 Tax=Auraticoccus monumenti TaxID=675864 RepID=A0A1G7BWZ2_9ACTN|nr:hypothetical protein [Auraticoccus monumenti]SDE31567.1 hypothetical protein SAMN04489747_3094 [Auraticoccus monumenti]
MSDPEHEIDVRNNPESRSGAADTTQSVARASDGGAPPRDIRTEGVRADPDPSGTRGSDPLAGVTASPEDVEEAVTPDTGPEEPGGRGATGRG